jgi:hypothetical protein
MDDVVWNHAVFSKNPRSPSEKEYGWLKKTGPLRQAKLRGLANVD